MFSFGLENNGFLYSAPKGRREGGKGLEVKICTPKIFFARGIHLDEQSYARQNNYRAHLLRDIIES